MKRDITHGRLKVINRLVDRHKFTLNAGSGNSKIGDIAIDIDASCFPDVNADVRRLPFRSNVFEQVVFTDVIEHLPKRDAKKALREIHRVLIRSGVLILTTPHARLLFTLLDPYWHTKGHRHCKKREIKRLLESSGFEIINFFTAGGTWMCIKTLLYFLMRDLPGRHSSGISPCVSHQYPFVRSHTRLMDIEYSRIGDKGYTIFIKAMRL